MQTLYGEDLPLYLGHQKIPSRRGVQQGCNFGTFLFALAIHPIIQPADTAWLSRWYADDGVILGPVRQVEAIFSTLVERFATLGLTVNRSKCTICGPGAQMVSTHMDDLALKECTLIPWTADAGFVLLGTPIHHPGMPPTGNAFMHRWWDDKRKQLAQEITKVTTFGDAHVQHALLSTCLSTSKIEHALRAADPTGCVSHFADIKHVLIEGIQKTLGTPLTDDQVQQCFLPTREGGLGYRDPTTVWAACRLAASAAFLRDLPHEGDFHPILESLDTILPGGTRDAIQVLRSTVDSGQLRLQAWADDPSSLATTEATDTASFTWNGRVQKSLAKQWKLVGHGRDAIRKSLLNASSLEWLSTAPVAARSTLLGHEEFKSATKFYLGAQLLPECHVGCSCPKCGRPLDAWGDHPLSCTMNGLTERHSQLRDKVLDLARRGGYAASKEGALPDGDRPADVLVPRWDAHGSAAIDITCVHPLKASDNNSTPEMAVKSLAHAQDEKVRKYEARCSQVNWTFVPAVCHTFGGWFGKGKGAIQKILLRVAKEEQSCAEPNQPRPSAELSYLMAHVTGQQLTILLDAGYHEANIPKRPRLHLPPPGPHEVEGPDAKRTCPGGPTSSPRPK